MIVVAIFVGGAVTLILMAAVLAIFLVVEIPVPVAEQTDGAGQAVEA